MVKRFFLALSILTLAQVSSAQAGKRGNPKCLVKTTMAVFQLPGDSPSNVTHVSKGDAVTLLETFMMNGRQIATVYQTRVANGYFTYTPRSNLICLPPKASDD